MRFFLNSQKFWIIILFLFSFLHVFWYLHLVVCFWILAISHKSSFCLLALVKICCVFASFCSFLARFLFFGKDMHYSLSRINLTIGTAVYFWNEDYGVGKMECISSVSFRCVPPSFSGSEFSLRISTLSMDSKGSIMILLLVENTSQEEQNLQFIRLNYSDLDVENEKFFTSTVYSAPRKVFSFLLFFPRWNVKFPFSNCFFFFNSYLLF